jgi:hypothetical protein
VRTVAVKRLKNSINSFKAAIERIKGYEDEES